MTFSNSMSAEELAKATLAGMTEEERKNMRATKRLVHVPTDGSDHEVFFKRGTQPTDEMDEVQIEARKDAIRSATEAMRDEMDQVADDLEKGRRRHRRDFKGLRRRNTQMTEFEEKIKTASSTEDMRKARLADPEAFEQYRREAAAENINDAERARSKVEKSADQIKFDQKVDEIISTEKVSKTKAMMEARKRHPNLFLKAFGRQS